MSISVCEQEGEKERERDMHLCLALPYPSEGHDVEGVLAPVDGVQEVAVADLRPRQHLQLTNHAHV